MACWHRRCLQCTVTFHGSWHVEGYRVSLRRAHPLGGYPGGRVLKMHMFAAGGTAVSEAIAASEAGGSAASEGARHIEL